MNLVSVIWSWLLRGLWIQHCFKTAWSAHRLGLLWEHVSRSRMLLVTTSLDIDADHIRNAIHRLLMYWLLIIEVLSIIKLRWHLVERCRSRLGKYVGLLFIDHLLLLLFWLLLRDLIECWRRWSQLLRHCERRGHYVYKIRLTHYLLLRCSYLTCSNNILKLSYSLIISFLNNI